MRESPHSMGHRLKRSSPAGHSPCAMFFWKASRESCPRPAATSLPPNLLPLIPDVHAIRGRRRRDCRYPPSLRRPCCISPVADGLAEPAATGLVATHEAPLAVERRVSHALHGAITRSRVRGTPQADGCRAGSFGRRRGGCVDRSNPRSDRSVRPGAVARSGSGPRGGRSHRDTRFGDRLLSGWYHGASCSSGDSDHPREYPRFRVVRHGRATVHTTPTEGTNLVIFRSNRRQGDSWRERVAERFVCEIAGWRPSPPSQSP